MPNQNQVTSMIRTVLAWVFGTTVVAAFFAKIGIPLDANTITVLIGVLAGIGGFLWSLVTHTKAATVAKAADIVPIPATVQAQAGIDPAKAQTIPTSPKA